MDEKLGGTTPMDIIIEAPVRDASAEEDEWEDEFDEFDEALDDGEQGGFANRSYWFNTHMLEQVADMHRYLESLPETGKVLSLHTAMSLLYKLEDEDAVDNMFLSVLYNNLLQSLFRSQIQTLGMVFFAILITFALVFRSIKVALIAIVPNIIPVVLSNFMPTIYFGLFTAFAMISALLSNVTVLPVLLRSLKPYGKLQQI